MDSREVLRRLASAGWQEVARVGSHVQLKHPERPGRVTVPHPKRDLPVGTLRSIEKQAGLKLRQGRTQMTDYIALIHKDADSDYGVSFPDLPGCVTAGRTLDEARAQATAALALHLDGMMQDGEAAPVASSLERIMADAFNRDAVAILVSAPVAASVSALAPGRVELDFSRDDLLRIDALAARCGLSRTAFLAETTQRALRESEHGTNGPT